MNLEHKLNQAIERLDKLEKENKKLKKKNKKLEQKIASKSHKKEKNGDRNQTTRRDFLKKLGAGLIGLGALSLSPTSALDVKDSHGFQVYDDTNTEYLDVNPNGPVQIKNTNLQVKGNSAVHGGNLSNFNISNFSGSNGAGGQVLQTDGSSLSWTNINVPVDSVFGRTGSVTAQSGDYSASQITNFNSTAISAINNDTDHGSTASHNYFSGSHSDLSNIGSSDHHTRYADNEAVSAVNNETSLTVNITGDSDSVDGYDVQKNGSDTTGVINFKT